MTEVNVNNEEQVQETTVDTVTENEQVESTESTQLSAEERLKAIEDELESKKELIKQLRKYEKGQKEAKEQALKDQNNFKQLYEEATEKLSKYEREIKDQKIDAAIAEVAKENGVRSINTLQKLIDKSRIEISDDNEVSIESIQQLIVELQKTDSILFETARIETPPVKRANDDTNVSSFETDLRKAKSQKEIESVLMRYGKM
jgi:hypothetical protein